MLVSNMGPPYSACPVSAGATPKQHSCSVKRTATMHAPVQPRQTPKPATRFQITMTIAIRASRPAARAAKHVPIIAMPKTVASPNCNGIVPGHSSRPRFRKASQFVTAEIHSHMHVILETNGRKLMTNSMSNVCTTIQTMALARLSTATITADSTIRFAISQMPQNHACPT